MNAPGRGVTIVLVGLALLTGMGLTIDAGLRSSATYDEVAYLEIASDWWRTGRTERITRMGSPLSFWKIQQAPVLLAIDRAGFGSLIDDPVGSQASLLPMVRVGSSWIFGLGLLLTAGWAAWELGRGAAVVAAWWYALSPNLIAHGSLVTMEAPLLTATAGFFWAFSVYLRTGRWRHLSLAAAIAGLAFSCKFTAILLPVIAVGAWAWCRLRAGESLWPTLIGSAGRLTVFLGVMGLANLMVTLGATIPMSKQVGHHPAIERALGPHLGSLAARLVELPYPQDAVAFGRQLQHQRSGGPSYLLGQTRQHGWWYYYLASLLVKVPPGVVPLVGLGVLAAMRGTGHRATTAGQQLAGFAMAATLLITALGSSRNYGFRYILFLAPAAILWISSLVRAGAAGRVVVGLGLLVQAAAVVVSHPAELSYFNQIAGGPEGGKRWLADSNLDWGQGLKALGRLQSERPELRDLTLLYFGDTDPIHYGIMGRSRVVDAQGPRGFEWSAALDGQTAYVGISRSLSFGPWAPSVLMAPLRAVEPVAVTDDHTIGVYRRESLESVLERR